MQNNVVLHQHLPLPCQSAAGARKPARQRPSTKAKPGPLFQLT